MGVLCALFGGLGAVVGLLIGSTPLVIVRVRQSMQIAQQADRTAREKLLDALTTQESAHRPV